MIINCELTANKIKEKAKRMLECFNLKPTLALIRVVGDDASLVYVKHKVKACDELGINSKVYEFPNDISEEKFLEEVMKINNDSAINGVLVQLPLPEHINKSAALNTIDPYKDVDCLGVASLGQFFGETEDLSVPCTPRGILSIIKDTVGSIEGNRVLIINRSMLVGKPLVELLQRENATVTLAHSKTGKETLKALMALSDIIITGVGKADFITEETVNEYSKIRKELKLPPQIIIDVSMNRDSNGKLCGDVSKKIYDREDIYVTPVPKGVGVTTVASLLYNVADLSNIQYLLNNL